jgi:hypothetical protein
MQSIEFIQSVIRSKPHKTIPVFQHSVDCTGRQTILTSEVDKMQIHTLCRRSFRKADQEQKKNTILQFHVIHLLTSGAVAKETQSHSQDTILHV